MDQANMLSIVGGLYDKLVADVADVVICKLKAESVAVMALDPEAVQQVMLQLLETDQTIREEVRDVHESTFDQIESRLDALENAEHPTVDADDSDFQDAVCSVIRNSI
ncbi:hypothetical protein K0U83_16860 [bacterium]|nr:hypothetical protein [bacterium]